MAGGARQAVRAGHFEEVRSQGAEPDLLIRGRKVNSLAVTISTTLDSTDHRIDNRAVEFNTVGVNAVRYGIEGFGDSAARDVFRMTQDLDRLEVELGEGEFTSM